MSAVLLAMMSSLHSASESASFGRLSEPVRRWIWRQGWGELRAVQERAIPVLLEPTTDVVIAAPMAAGKTEAAFLPIISRIAGQEGRGFQALYLSPLKALINDQFRRLEALCEAVGLPIWRWHGDVASDTKAKARRQPRGIVLMTPESLEALFVRRGLEVPALFASLQAIVIDEVHALMGSERGVQVQSLLHRLESAIGRRVVRVGLSATLGDPTTAAAFLRPDAAEAVVLLESRGGGPEVRLQLRGYRRGQDPSGREPATAHRQIAGHLLRCLSGSHHLVFTGARGEVELYADLLRRLSEERRLPTGFFPHHANLARGEREALEQRLRDEAQPATAVCTSTLELGIDIGQVESVAQIGVPASVASLRQRLGRSGRRAGSPAMLRLYVTERALGAALHPVDRLRCGLVQAVAMVRLLSAGWCESPHHGGLHLSTLVHQVLALIAQHGGITAGRAYVVLCGGGPFAAVNPALFARVLRAIGASGLIEQAPDGTLLPGRIGERLLESHAFYAVFETPREYRLVADGRTLGTLPIVVPITAGTSLIFAGRRWRVLEAQDQAATLLLAPSEAGVVPLFGGEGGEIDEAIIAEMRRVYEGDDVPTFLDPTACELLEEARQAYRELGLATRKLVESDGGWLLFPWAGSVVAGTFALALKAVGLAASVRQIAIEVEGAGREELRAALERLIASPPNAAEIAAQADTLCRHKYDRFLTRELLLEAFAADGVSPDAIRQMARSMSAAMPPSP